LRSVDAEKLDGHALPELDVPGSQWLSVLLLAGKVALVRRLVRAGPFKARASEPSAPFGGALLLL
jgi:hypothetical protein